MFDSKHLSQGKLNQNGKKHQQIQVKGVTFSRKKALKCEQDNSDLCECDAIILILCFNYVVNCKYVWFIYAQLS